jgi:hypothetical protein
MILLHFYFFNCFTFILETLSLAQNKDFLSPMLEPLVIHELENTRISVEGMCPNFISRNFTERTEYDSKNIHSN